MIDYEGNNYQPRPQQTEQQKPPTNGDDTVRWLEDHCRFRPIGAEW